MIKSFPDRTRERALRLRDYMKANVLSGDTFICRHFAQCRASRAEFPFYEGQLSHVGRNYDLEIDGREVRIMFVGQEYGTGERHHGLEQRSQMVTKSAAIGFKGRNKHMKGTTSKLRLLLGRPVGSDAEDERLLDGHLFDGFALVNYLLCSALKNPRGHYESGAGKGHSSSTMQRNCQAHFQCTLEILEPTVLVVQGQGVRHWLEGIFPRSDQRPAIEGAVFRGKPLTLATFDHPSAGGKSGYWGGSLNSRYLRDIVVPAMREIALIRQNGEGQGFPAQ